MKKCVAFSLYARIMEERSTNHSLPALSFFFKRRSAVVKEEFLFISAVFVVVVVVVLLSGTSPGQCSSLLPL